MCSLCTQSLKINPCESISSNQVLLFLIVVSKTIFQSSNLLIFQSSNLLIFQSPWIHLFIKMHRCISTFTTLSSACQWTPLSICFPWRWLKVAYLTARLGGLTSWIFKLSAISHQLTAPLSSKFFNLSIRQTLLVYRLLLTLLLLLLLLLLTISSTNYATWRISESNRWPPACKAGALASWANPPCFSKRWSISANR